MNYVRSLWAENLTPGAPTPQKTDTSSQSIIADTCSPALPVSWHIIANSGTWSTRWLETFIRNCQLHGREAREVSYPTIWCRVMQNPEHVFGSVSCVGYDQTAKIIFNGRKKNVLWTRTEIGDVHSVSSILWNVSIKCYYSLIFITSRTLTHCWR